MNKELKFWLIFILLSVPLLLLVELAMNHGKIAIQEVVIVMATSIAYAAVVRKVSKKNAAAKQAKNNK